MASTIVAALIEHRNRNLRSDRGSLRKEVGDLLYTNPFAFLVGAAFDRGMLWQRAWEIPYWIDQKGHLDASNLAAMEEPDLQRLLESLPVKPRYGCVKGARTLSDAANLVMRFDAGGDAGAIWDGVSPLEVQKRLESVYGIGPGIAHMAIRILRDDWGKFRGQEREIDVKPDVHVMRVFKRTELTQTENERKTVEAARELNPPFPGELDWPAWDIGINWCRPTNPLCGDCPLTAVCPTSKSRRRPGRVMAAQATPRLVREDDADQIAAVYEPYARDTAITFVYAAPTGADFRDRIQRTIDRLPWFVCERDGLVTGYAYASPHRVSSAYRWSVETSIYIHPDHHRAGIGTALYTALLGTLRLLGYHRAYAGVTEPNLASIRLHEAVGFEQIGTFHEVGYKLGAWRDVIWLEYALGNADFPPAEPLGFPELLGTPEWEAAVAAGQALLR